jgi:hypothetical protein
VRRCSLARFALVATLAACDKRADPPGSTTIAAEPVRPQDDATREGPAPEPRLHPVGLWAVAPFVNALAGEHDVNDGPWLSIAPGDAPETFLVRVTPG